MSALIALALIAVLVVPVIIVGTLFSLSATTKQLKEDIHFLKARLFRVESELARRTESPLGPEPVSARMKEAGLPAQRFPSSEEVSAAGPVELSPNLAPAAAPPPLASWPQPVLPMPPASAWQRCSAAAPPPLDEPMDGAQFVDPLNSLPARERTRAINWEQFMGVKLFAWIGGFALFLGVAFFIKYSFERNLIPPEARAAIGFLTGLGLICGGIFMKRRELMVTSQTLCATGVVILYAVTFACRSVYHFAWFGPVSTFLVMTLITAAAFTLAVRMEAMVVAILGLVGGFLTPLLLSTGQDNPVGLFSYIALLDIGLIAVAFRRRWHFLIAMGAVGTILMQAAWVGSFFADHKVFIALAIFLGFNLLFLLAFWAGEQLEQASDWLTASAIGLPFVTMLFTWYLLSFESLGARPGTLFSFVLGADLCLLALVLLRSTLQGVHLAAGGCAFLLLAAWTGQHLTSDLLFWALGLDLGFAVLHTAFPVVLARLSPTSTRVWWGSLFPAAALLLIFVPMLQQATVSFLIWPTVLLIDVLAVGLALVTGSMASLLIVLLLTMLATGVWILKIPEDLDAVPMLLLVTGGFALFFFVVATVAGKRIAKAAALADLPMDAQLNAFLGGESTEFGLTRQVPALSAILPFLLLMMAVARLPLSDPSLVFGLAMFLVALLLGLSLVTELGMLVPASGACALALQSVWFGQHFTAEWPWVPLLWNIAFYAVFTLFPFLSARRLNRNVLPWATSALAGPLHFFLIYRIVSAVFPSAHLGLLPAAMALPMLAAIMQIRRSVPADSSQRLNLLAWFGGSALFFITLIFPIEFERQWITLGWALEGLALLWLFHRVPHPGVRATGVVLLAIAFCRLALNPAVLGYQPDSQWRLVNWYLYAYGIVTLCLMSGARLLAPPRHLVWKQNMPPVLYTMGTVLAFLLVNIEIASFFTDSPTLTFQFSGNFARDMTYSIAWAFFALVLLSVGIWKRLPAPRYAAIGLLGVTLLKLFLHDLNELGQLYRIGAFIVVAAILMLASFLYQRFVSFERKPSNG